MSEGKTRAWIKGLTKGICAAWRSRGGIPAEMLTRGIKLWNKPFSAHHAGHHCSVPSTFFASPTICCT